MSKSVTLGGDRLGSGKKQKIHLHNYERSTHDLSYIWRSTMAAGTLVPFLCEVALPGDTFDLNLQANIMTHPTIGPLFGSFKVQIDVFQCPMRLYQGQLHNNKLGIGMKMNTVKLPILNFTPPIIDLTLPNIDVDNSQINPSCIMSYLGVRGIGTQPLHGSGTRAMNGIPLLAYWDIYKNYYANKQQEIGVVIHSPIEIQATIDEVKMDGNVIDPFPAVPTFTIPVDAAEFEIAYSAGTFEPSTLVFKIQNTRYPTPTWVALNQLGVLISDDLVANAVWTYDMATQGVGTIFGWTVNADLSGQKPIKLQEFPLKEIDDMREAILAHATSTSPFDVQAQDLKPYKYIFETMGSGAQTIQQNQEGLGIKTYQSDLLNNWLNTDWIDGVDGISAITSVDTSGGSFTIDAFQLARKVYDMLNRIAVSGGTYDDWLDAVYVHDRYTRCESPMYMGGLQQELIFQEVISNAAVQDAGQPLGTLAGRGRLGGNRKGGNVTIKVDEPSYIIGIISLTPRLDYSQGNKWDVNLQTIDDLHKPALDQIGFQELITEKAAWWETTWNGSRWVQKSAGKQPAWIDYMTNINQVRGNFAIETNEMFMVLTRRYEWKDTGGVPEIKDLTTYIDPMKFNHIFAQTSLDAQNYWTQIGVNMDVRRKISAKIMPNL